MASQDDKLSMKRETLWFGVIFNLQIFISFLISFHFIIYEACLLTTIFCVILILLGALGMTAGAHRLWAHQSYKATTSLRLFLMFCHTLAGSTSIYNWVRLHRLHHKYFQTDYDPFDSRKGFLHAHLICDITKLSPAQEKLLAEIDMSDLENDKIVMFQKKYYWGLFVAITLLFAWNTPMEFWGEDFLTTIFVLGWFRWFVNYHLSVLVHSAVTIFDINGADRASLDSNLIFLIDKTYWLSYHYLTPWDYQTSEFGKYGVDCTSKFIRVCAALEYASDLRTTDGSIIREALIKSVDEKKSVSESIKELEDGFKKKVSDQLYLSPSKFYQ